MPKSFHTSATALNTVEIAGVALVWYVLYKLNTWFFFGLEFRQSVNWIFLPAAIRVLAVLVLGWRGAVGLFIGALLTSNYETAVLWQVIMPPVISAVTPLLAVTLVSRLLMLAEDLRGLNFEQLSALSFAGAGLSAGVHIVFFALQASDAAVLLGFFPMFAGDLVGTMLVLYAAHFAMRVVIPVHTDHRK